MDLDLIRTTVDPIMSAHVTAEPLPGLAYGVVLDGRLVHSGGLGTVRLDDDRVPDADSVFRIASMTKSFTASTVLLLRDQGLLRLDDPVVQHVAELSGGAADTRVTLRDLLAMTAGFPTDDPWGDRQQSMSPGDFEAFLRSGPWQSWRPRDAYEYSNLGYAILGLVIARAAGAPYSQVVTDTLLRPLGMASTAFDVEALPRDRLAAGYVRRDEQWVEEPFAANGAFAPMGGLASSVRDLTTWVAGFQAAESGQPEGHPLDAASRREMQHAVRLVDADVTHPDPDAPAQLRVRGYGYGLVEEFHPEGRTVSHSGGYPGFGSHMRWHPESGLGIVTLGNRTYAPMTKLGTDALLALVRAVAPGTRRRQSTASPALSEARGVALRLLDRWDQGLVDEWFADNMAADEPYERRRETLERVRATHGPLTESPPDQDHDEPATPAMTSWWMDGERGGRVRVDLMVTPHPRPLIQWLAVTSVPEPDVALRSLAEKAVRERQADARWSQARLGPVTAGDGVQRATFRVLGGRLPAQVVVVAGAAPSWRVMPVRADIR